MSTVCPVPNFKMASMISDRVVKCSMIYLYIFQRQMFAYAQLQVFPPLNIGFLLSHNLDLVPVDLNPTVRRAHVKIVRRCSSHVLSPVANPETQKAYWESQGLHAIWCHLRLHTRIWDWPILEVLPLSPLDGSIRIPYCLGSCKGPSSWQYQFTSQQGQQPCFLKKCQHGNSVVELFDISSATCFVTANRHFWHVRMHAYLAKRYDPKPMSLNKDVDH